MNYGGQEINMDRTRRVLSLLLALCMMLCVLVACGDKGDTVENKDSEEIVARLLVSNLSKYSIIVPEGGASDGMAEALNELMTLFEERWGITLKLRDDFVVEGMPEFSEGQYEILVGETNRKESAEVFTDVKKCDDYEVRMSGDKLVIVGYNEAQLAVAIRSVIDEINAIPEDADYFFDESMQISFKGTYAIGEILIGETDISKYTVVYKHGDVCKALATMMADKILEKTGYSLNVVDDENASDEGKKILIGNTKFNTVDMPDEDGYYIGVDVDNISLCSTTVSGICKAVTHFIDLVDSATGDTVTLDLDLGLVMSEDTSMTSMSFNVYVGNQTTERKNRVIKMIERYMPDTLGVQEANNSWINALNNALGDTYAYVGIGRNSTSESAVPYSIKKINLTFWIAVLNGCRILPNRFQSIRTQPTIAYLLMRFSNVSRTASSLCI